MTESIKKQYNPSKAWYHGTNYDINKFSYDFLGKGKDLYGVGFYFTDNPNVASRYAIDADEDNKEKNITHSPNANANVLKVNLMLKKEVPKDKPLTTKQIEGIIKDSPDLDDRLSDYGDVDWEGKSTVFKRAVDSYKGIDAFRAMNMLSNDFYGNKHEHFLKSFTKHTGYDHVLTKFDDGDIVTVFHPHQIKSVNAKFNKISDNLIESVEKSDSIYTCPVCYDNSYSLIERRRNGNILCNNGHWYNSITRLPCCPLCRTEPENTWQSNNINCKKCGNVYNILDIK